MPVFEGLARGSESGGQGLQSSPVAVAPGALGRDLLAVERPPLFGEIETALASLLLKFGISTTHLDSNIEE